MVTKAPGANVNEAAFVFVTAPGSVVEITDQSTIRGLLATIVLSLCFVLLPSLVRFSSTVTFVLLLPSLLEVAFHLVLVLTVVGSLVRPASAKRSVASLWTFPSSH